MPRCRYVGGLAVSAGLAISMLGGVLSNPGVASAASGFKLSQPVNLGLVWAISGEGPEADSTGQDGALLAINKLNAAGGVGGKKVTYYRQTFTALNPQPATAQTLKAIAAKPTVMIGYEGPTVTAVMPQLKKAQIPTVGMFYTAQNQYTANSGSKYFFNVTSTDAVNGIVAVDYTLKKLKLKKVGVMSTNDPYGTTTSSATIAQLKKNGMSPVAYRQYAPTATDLTSEILATKGSNVLINWAYPNTIAVQLKQFQQTGNKIPTISGEAAQIAIADKLIPTSELNNLYTVTGCDPTATNASSGLKAFTKAYVAAFHTTPSELSVRAYDAVNFSAAAVTMAKSTSPAKVQAAMAKINFKGGLCSDIYKSNSEHTLPNTDTVSQFFSNGSSKIVGVYTNTPTS